MTKFLGVTIEAGGLAFQESGLESGSITELYTAINGANGLVDTVNTTALYNPTGDTYGQGVVQTKRLYDSATAITSLLINDLSTLFVGTRGTVDISFDDGGTWSTATNTIGTSITSFTGTSDDAGTYKLKLKFTLGAEYLESGAYVWVTTGSVSQTKSGAAGCGTTSAALVFGGHSGGGYSNTTEKWDGSSWVTTGVLTQSKNALAGCGTTAAALAIAGQTGAVVNTTEIWNGSAWATTGVVTTVKGGLSGCGTTAAALCFGGNSGTRLDTTDIWAGSTWATTTALVVVREDFAGCGTTAAALAIAGQTGAYTAVTEIWLASSWATTSSLTTVLSAHGGCGTTAAALCIAGASSGGTGLKKTEIWNGSVWATTTDLITARYVAESNCGTTSDALCIGASGISTVERWLNSGIQKGFSVKIN